MIAPSRNFPAPLRLSVPVAMRNPRVNQPLRAIEEDDSTWSIVTLLVAIFGGAFAALVCASGPSPWVAMFVMVSVLATMAVINPRACIFLTLCYLAVQGDVRRIISLGMPAGRDPMVLVGAVIALLLTGIAILQNRLTRGTKLSRAVFVLLVIMGIQALNPLQGGLMVGFTGVLCVMVPMCWFWIGQSWGSERFVNLMLFRGIVPVAIGAAAFGLVQVFIGRPEYQQEWMRMWSRIYLMSYGLDLDLTNPDWNRPFSFFTSVSEFSKFLAVSVVLLMGSLIGGRFRIALLAIPGILLAMFLTSCRGPIVFSCGVTAILWAMRGRTISQWLVRSVLAVVCMLAGLTWTMAHVHELDVSSPHVDYLIKHQTEGLLNPLDSSKSSVTGHVLMPIHGIIDSLKNPLGRGLGLATHVASAYGDGYVATEVDLSNMFVCLGVIGGLAYALVYFRTFTTATEYWRTTRAPLALSLTAVCLVLAGSWLSTGEYSTISLVWFCIGSLDRLSNQVRTSP